MATSPGVPGKSIGLVTFCLSCGERIEITTGIYADACPCEHLLPHNDGAHRVVLYPDPDDPGEMRAQMIIEIPDEPKEPKR